MDRAQYGCKARHGARRTFDHFVFASRKQVWVAWRHRQPAHSRNVASQRQLQRAGRKVPDLLGGGGHALNTESHTTLRSARHGTPHPQACGATSQGWRTLMVRSPAPVANHWFPGSTVMDRGQPTWPLITRINFHGACQVGLGTLLARRRVRAWLCLATQAHSKEAQKGGGGLSRDTTWKRAKPNTHNSWAHQYGNANVREDKEGTPALNAGNHVHACVHVPAPLWILGQLSKRQCMQPSW